MREESYSVSEAARALGVSIPTLKRMAHDGRIETFRTPGGHLRVTAESLVNTRAPRPALNFPPASSVLQNRRERVEELGLEAQELRAKREIAKLQADQEAEARRRQEEAQAQERAASREAEAQRLRLERVRLRSQQQEQERQQAERLAMWRAKWLENATARLPYWLSPGQRKEAVQALEVEVAKRGPESERFMDQLIEDTVGALMAPWKVEREGREARERATNSALFTLPLFCTELERSRAAAAIREALGALPLEAEEFEIRAAANEAIQPIKQAAEKRLLDERLIEWAIRELPWGRTEQDEARLRRQCVEILAGLPPDVSEVEAKEVLRPPVREVQAEIEQREARKERKQRKAALIQQGLVEVSSYLLHLRSEGEISSEAFWDSRFAADVTDAVRDALEEELTGDEDTQELKEFVHEIIEDELR